jgi:Protein of unknown function (DUF2939)
MKKASLLVALTACAVAGWYWYSPVRAVDALETAVRNGDEAALEKIVDFDAVRTNLKADLHQAIDSKDRSREDRPLASIGAAIGGAIADGAVDAFVTPRAVAAAVRGRASLRSDAAEDDVDRVDFDIDRSGPSRFYARARTDDRDGVRATFQFARRGLGWRVVRLEVPGFADRLRDQT